MSADEAAAIVTGIRGAVQDFLAPEIREMRADMRAIRDRLEVIDKGFDRPDDQLSTYRDVQSLKDQMAELRARQQPSA